jgi:hypothetical protein
MKAIILLALAALLGCDSDLPPQITACDQLTLQDPEELTAFLTLNNGLTCDLPAPAEGQPFSCTTGPDQQACGAPSGVTLVGCNCTDGVIECFNRQNEVDRLNDMCGS